MIAKLFSKRRARQPDATLPQGQRVYAVGDIHGRCDLLDMLLDQIARDDAERGDAETMLIFLGDLIDRGPESAQVVERLRQLAETRPAQSTRFLLGNHEEVFLAALAGSVKALKFFNRIGGRETILSYGVPEALYRNADYEELLEELQAKVPAEHIRFLQGFEDLILAGDYVFVHAGIRPGTPLTHQRVSDLRWIREEFMGFTGAHEKIVVHGHTITDEVDVQAWRIGLDTGAFASGKLSGMGFEGNQRWLLQADSVTVS